MGSRSLEVALGRAVDRMRNSRLSELSTWQRQMNQAAWQESPRLTKRQWRLAVIAGRLVCRVKGVDS